MGAFFVIAKSGDGIGGGMGGGRHTDGLWVHDAISELREEIERRLKL